MERPYHRSYPRGSSLLLSAADPQTSGEESHQNAIKFSGEDGLRKLAFYLRDSLHVISGDLTGCIMHLQLVFTFGRVRLQNPRAGQPVETNIAAKIMFEASKIVKGQMCISWPLVF